MIEADIVEALRDFMKGEFPVQAENIAGLSADDSLEALGVLDSLSLASIITFIEMKWSVKIKPADFRAENFQSLNHIRATVERYLQHPS